jgi:hypothetical protein
VTYDDILFNHQSATQLYRAERLAGETALQFIDRIDCLYPPCVLRIFVKIFAKCMREGTNRIETTASALAGELGASPDTMRIARRVLCGVLDISTTYRGTLWIFPVDWLDHTTQKPSASQRARAPERTYREPSPYEVFN